MKRNSVYALAAMIIAAASAIRATSPTPPAIRASAIILTDEQGRDAAQVCVKRGKVEVIYLGGNGANASTPPQAAPSPTSQTGYTESRSGKIHKADCQFANAASPVELDEALARGLVRCKVCFKK